MMRVLNLGAGVQSRTLALLFGKECEGMCGV